MKGKLKKCISIELKNYIAISSMRLVSAHILLGGGGITNWHLIMKAVAGGFVHVYKTLRWFA